MKWNPALDQHNKIIHTKMYPMLNKKKIVKGVIYRFYSSLITFTISFILTQQFLVSLSIGILDSVIKIFSYYLFEVLWVKFTGFNAKPAVIFLTGF